MKKGFSLLALMTLALLIAPCLSFGGWDAIDMADYGTTAYVTNGASAASTLTYAMITYDSASTNTLAVYVTKDSVDYRLGTSTVTNVQYVTIDLTDMAYENGDVLKITTTITNATVLVQTE